MHGLGIALLLGPKDSFRRLSNTNAHCRVERTTHDTAHDRHDLGKIDETPLTGLGQEAKADTLVDFNKDFVLEYDRSLQQRHAFRSLFRDLSGFPYLNRQLWRAEQGCGRGPH